MDHAQYSVQPARSLEHDAQRVVIECAHGRSFGLVLAGRAPLPDAIALDLLAARHGTTYGCQCSDVLRPVDPAVVSSAARYGTNGVHRATPFIPEGRLP